MYNGGRRLEKICISTFNIGGITLYILFLDAMGYHDFCAL